MPENTIEITDHQSSMMVDHRALECAIRRVLADEQIGAATLCLALVNDEEIQRVNREFLGHDFATDVISFRLNECPDSTDSAARQMESTGSAESPGRHLDEIPSGNDLSLEGELIVSTETAVREAASHGWSPEAELLLYVVHGLLHLCGYDDLTDEARPVMRSRERELLALWGFCPTGLEP
jgi:probable rRNA maturation factor